MRYLRIIRILCLLIFLSACNQGGSTTGEPSKNAQFVDTIASTVVPTDSAPASLPSATAYPTSTVAPTPLSTSHPTASENLNGRLNPLTGLSVSEPELLNRHPVMVKLANWPREERPQAGLSQADMVFEYYIGHQMNQFLALY
mgnify:CR=1 FL=1